MPAWFLHTLLLHTSTLRVRVRVKPQKEKLLNGSCVMKPKGGALPFRDGHHFSFNGLFASVAVKWLFEFPGILRGFGGERLQS